MATIVEDPRTALLAAPMSTYQKIAVAVVVVLCMLDGLDVMAITFAMPAIKAAWGINQSQVGLVLASGLLGMAAGSLLLAPAADVIGRRRLIFLSLTIMITGTFWSAATDNVRELMLSRVYTGLGIGAMIAVISSLTAEYSNTRRRDFSQAMFGIGFPIGGLFGGFLASRLLPSYGWQAIFVAASIFGLVLVPIVWKFLPEPIAPMIARPKANTLDRVNHYLKRCGMPLISQLPPPPVDAKSAPLRALFASGMASVTVMIAAIYFLHVVTLFFVQSWVPSLIAGVGFAPAEAARIAVWLNLGGLISGPLLGASSMRFGLKPLAFTGLAGGALMTAVFGSLPPAFLPLLLGTIGMGFFLQGGMIGLYAVIARTFPAHMRASGTGFVIGVGRIGSAVGPALAGVLMTAGMTRSNVAIAMAVPAFLAALLLLKYRVRAPDTP
jgi:MFS transporter, AAHS family, 4-hydroxybenzoate transporter